MFVNNVRCRKGIREGSHKEETNLENNKDSDSQSESDETYESNVNLTNVPKQKNDCIISNKSIPKIIIYILLGLFGIVALWYYAGDQILSMHQKEQRICSFENLRNEYPSETDFKWKNLQIGIEMILNKKIGKPAVFLLAHHGKNSSYNLITKIAQHSSKCFGKDFIAMKSDDFVQYSESNDDYGYAIEKYKSKIKEGGVFLIANLNEIPVKAARALHSICDTHSPIRRDVVIFLTLTIRENKKGNSNSIAEEELAELWGSEIGLHELDPLITRVTDQVIILET